MTAKLVYDVVYANVEFNADINDVIKDLNTVRETAMNRGMIAGTSNIIFNNSNHGGCEIVFEFKREETDTERAGREKFEANAERAEYERLKAKFG